MMPDRAAGGGPRALRLRPGLPAGRALPAAPWRDQLAFAQGTYFLTAGVWPLVHMPSFLKVTGPKAELWLVRTVGALMAVAGGALMSAALRRRVTPEMAGLAVGSAAVLGAVDVIYTARFRIPPIYLLDAAVEGALLAAWAGLAGRSGPCPDEAAQGQPSPIV